MVLDDYVCHLTLDIAMGKVYTEKEVIYVHYHCVDHDKVVSKDKALVNFKWPAIEVEL